MHATNTKNEKLKCEKEFFETIAYDLEMSSEIYNKYVVDFYHQKNFCSLYFANENKYDGRKQFVFYCKLEKDGGNNLYTAYFNYKKDNFNSEAIMHTNSLVSIVEMEDAPFTDEEKTAILANLVLLLENV
jgi:hypothetical protein